MLLRDFKTSFWSLWIWVQTKSKIYCTFIFKNCLLIEYQLRNFYFMRMCFLWHVLNWQIKTCIIRLPFYLRLMFYIGYRRENFLSITMHSSSEPSLLRTIGTGGRKSQNWQLCLFNQKVYHCKTCENGTVYSKNLS